MHNNQKDFFKHLEEIKQKFAQRDVFVFLDYDGTLTTIVDTPDKAIITEDMRQAVKDLAGLYKVSIVSGRATDDVRSKAQLDGIFYAGSHGFEIVDPQGVVTINEEAKAIRPKVDQLQSELSDKVKDIEGALIENVKYTISCHYRLVADEDFPKFKKIVEEGLNANPDFRMTSGKKVFELRPRIDWHKGRAVAFILNVLKFDPGKNLVIYIGDDTTDEDAFEEIKDKGFGILVADDGRASRAEYLVKNTDDVKRVLEYFIKIKQ